MSTVRRPAPALGKGAASSLVEPFGQNDGVSAPRQARVGNLRRRRFLFGDKASRVMCLVAPVHGRPLRARHARFRLRSGEGSDDPRSLGQRPSHPGESDVA
jgi:hypothetical protein